MQHHVFSITDIRLINRELTRRLFKLHASGYDLDFFMNDKRVLKCFQSPDDFPCDSITVSLVDQIYDFFGNCYKYVHTVETSCGKKGILLLDGIYRFSAATVVDKSPSYKQMA